MRNMFWFSLPLAALLATDCIAAQSQQTGFPHSATSTVIVVYETQDYPCGPQVPPHPDPNPRFWRLREGKSQFKFHQKGEVTFNIKRVRPKNEDPEMEEPGFIVFNEREPVLEGAPCEPVPSFQKLPFAFAIHDIADPDHPMDPPEPHALMYIPVHEKTSKEPYKEDQFYLLIFDIKKDARYCERLPSFRDECKALNELWALQMGGASITEMTLAIMNKIDRIKPSVMPNKFHNGVIHGNL